MQKDNLQVIVAINKIDAPLADVVRAKNSLIENEIYIEGFGGSIPVVEISAKTGKNIGDLLDLILLSAEVENLTGDTSKGASGYIVEVNKDKDRKSVV
jgi:translation initiation factor IF-2